MALKVISKLDNAIKKYQKDVSKSLERDITIQEIMETLGEVAEVSWTTIKRIKNNNVLPSLPVAIKIAEFLDYSVEELWTVEYEESIIDEEKKSNKKQIKKSKPKCKEEGCEKESFARGLCGKHYQQFRYLNLSLFKNDKPTHCTIEGCEEPYYAKNLCSFHYNRDYRINRTSEESKNE
jgi:DNA-binding XRE family transcriptional regulator